MSKKKRNDDLRFEEGRKGDSDEKDAHVRPTDDQVSVNAPAGAWVDVPKGMVAVPDTYVDDDGILRRAGGGEVAIWHHRCKVHGPCERYSLGNFLRADEIVYVNGAPWCPDCLVKSAEDKRQKELIEKVRESFGNN